MSRTIRTNGAELVVEEAGTDGPALVFLHYWGGSARTWDAVVARLPARLRKMVVNQCGWGGSRATGGRYDLEALADDVAAVVEDREIGRYVLVGHSMGGKVAQVLAGRRAHGLAGLVLVAPAPPTSMEVPAEVRTGMLTSYRAREGVLQALGVLAGSALDEAKREQLIADTLRGEAGAAGGELGSCSPTRISVGQVMRCSSETRSRAEIMSHMAAWTRGSSASNVFVTRSIRSGRRATIPALS